MEKYQGEHCRSSFSLNNEEEINSQQFIYYLFPRPPAHQSTPDRRRYIPKLDRPSS